MILDNELLSELSAVLISLWSNSHVWLECSALEGLVGRGKDSFTSKGLSLRYNPNPTGVENIHWCQGVLDHPTGVENIHCYLGWLENPTGVQDIHCYQGLGITLLVS